MGERDERDEANKDYNTLFPPDNNGYNSDIAPEDFSYFNTKSVSDFSDFLRSIPTIPTNPNSEESCSIQLNLMKLVSNICQETIDHKKDYTTFVSRTQSLNERWFAKVSKCTTPKHMIDSSTGYVVLRRNVLLRCPTNDISAFLRVLVILCKSGNKYYPVESLSLSKNASEAFIIHAARVKYADFNEQKLEEYPNSDGKLFYIYSKRNQKSQKGYCWFVRLPLIHVSK